MKIIEKAVMTNGTKIQIVDWSDDYNFLEKQVEIAAYLKSKETLDGEFTPVRNKSFRCAFEFETLEKAQEIFKSLLQGTISLKDCHEFMVNKEYFICL